MESSRDSGCRHELGRFVQFCACRKPTITICRVMKFAPCVSCRCCWFASNVCCRLFQVQFVCEFVLRGELLQLGPGRVLDVDTVLPALLFADVLDLARVEYAGASFRGWCFLEIAREFTDLFLEFGERAERLDIEHRHEATVVVPAGRLDAEAKAGE